MSNAGGTMTDDQHLIEVLRALVPEARYGGGGRTIITGTDFRNAWNSPIPALSQTWLFVEVTPPAGFDRLLVGLRSMLRAFMSRNDNGDEFVLTHLDYIVGGVGMYGTPFHRFAKQVLTSAVLVGPDKTVSILRAWVDGEPIRFTRFTALSGLTMEKDREFSLGGLTIRRLPAGQRGLHDLGAPDAWVGSPLSMMGIPLGGPRIFSAPAVVVKRTAGPVFADSKDMAEPGFKTVDSFIVGPDESLMAGLSLASDSAVAPTCAWSQFPVDVYSFVPLARFIGNQAVLYGSAHSGMGEKALTDEIFAKALHLAGKIVAHGIGTNTRRALARWTKSKAGGPDTFIDLRIALEALYASDGGGEVSFRLQTRCAKHLERSIDKRLALAKVVRDFYGTASRHAHAKDDPRPKRKYLEQLARAQEIGRAALMRIIDEGKGRDLDMGQLTFTEALAPR